MKSGKEKSKKLKTGRIVIAVGFLCLTIFGSGCFTISLPVSEHGSIWGYLIFQQPFKSHKEKKKDLINNEDPWVPKVEFGNLNQTPESEYVESFIDGYH